MSTGMSDGATPVPRAIVVPRTARYFVLGEQTAPTEVWFVLHGYLQEVERFLAWWEPARQEGRMIVAPEALSRAYIDAPHQKVGASWMTRTEREQEIADYVRYLDLVAREVLAGRDDVRIEVHGFSQGAATACRWAVQGQVRPDRVTLWGNGVPPDLDLDRLRHALGGEPVHLRIGTEDEYITPKIVEREKARLEAGGMPYDLRLFSGGHRVQWPV